MRYGVGLTAAQIDDFIKDRLVPKGKRIGNDGKKPVYDYDFRAYRRALQIARLRTLGIIGRDAIRLQLFLRGYSLSVDDVRNAVLNEYRRAVKSFRLRSIYFENWKGIPNGRKESAVAELGVLDHRLDKAGLRLPNHIYIENMRAAKQKGLEDCPMPQPLFAVHGIEALPKQIEVAIQSVMKYPSDLFSGLFNLADNDADSLDPGCIEGTIQTADDTDYIQAREFYKLMVGKLGQSIFEAQMSHVSEARIEAGELIRASIKDVPEFACAMFVFSLWLVKWGAFIDFKQTDLLTAHADPYSQELLDTRSASTC